MSVDELGNRGKKFLHDVLKIACEKSPEQGKRMQWLIEEVKNGKREASTFLNDLQLLVGPITVKTGDDNQSPIDSSTLVNMIHAALNQSRSLTPRTTPSIQMQQHPIQGSQSQIRIAPSPAQVV